MTIVNHECYVSLDVTKLLKEAGFDWECRKIYYCYHEDGDTWELEDNYKNYKSILKLDHCLLTPTLDVAQRWLREEKNLILLIDITPSYCNGKPMGYKFVIHVSCGNHIWGEWKDTYEEAQEVGIKKALEIILENVK